MSWLGKKEKYLQLVGQYQGGNEEKIEGILCSRKSVGKGMQDLYWLPPVDKEDPFLLAESVLSHPKMISLAQFLKMTISTGEAHRVIS